MKFKLAKLLIMAAFAACSYMSMQAQVTVGSGIAPERGALLDHKEKDTETPTPDIASLENSTKGVLYPKVFLRDAAKLTPLYGGSDDGSGVWSDESSDEEKLKATGMVVYNVNPDAVNMNDGLYMWQLNEWVKLNQNGAAVIRPVDCSAIRINGAYIQGTPVTDNNYLEIDLNVDKEGSFVISVLSGNGYSFYYTGVALEKGGLTVKVPAQGTPALVQTDKLTFNGISLVPGCEPEIAIQEMVAAYTMLCGSVTVKGDYYKTKPLTGANVIEININISQPGSYYIYTEPINGIHFEAKGSFANIGTQTITLVGTGAPTINEDFQVVIKANTKQATIECSAWISIVLPKMTYAIIGRDIWSWAANARTQALSDPHSVSFGPDARVRIESFEELWSTDDVATASTNLTGGVGGKYPDIVLYFAFAASPTDQLTSALIEYINKGGCVIYGAADNTENAVSRMLQAIFGISAEGQTAWRGDDQVYEILDESSDPIVNGPFGNLAGRHWGEDNAHGGSVLIPALPPNSVQICSAQPASDPSANPDHSMVWYSKSKNFVYFGDSAGAAIGNTEDAAFPTVYSSSYLPVSKLYGPGNAAYKRYVYNAALELNAVAYLIRKAADSGINPH